MAESTKKWMEISRSYRTYMRLEKHLEAIEAAAAEIQTLNYRQYEDPRLSELTELITRKTAALKD